MDDAARWVQETWEAMCRGDLAPFESALAPDAQWRAVEDGPWNCKNKATIIEMMNRNLTDGLAGEVEVVVEVGDRLIVAFRPSQHDNEGWPLDHGIRYMVVTMDGELVTELKGCLNRQVALDYAGAQ